MKNQPLFQSAKSPLALSASPSSLMRKSPLSSTSTSHATLYWSSNEAGNTPCGSSVGNSRPSPESDFQGLEVTYLRKEAQRHYYIGAVYLILAVHSSLACLYLAFDSSEPVAVLAAVIASFFWQRAIAHGRSAAELYSAIAGE